VVEVVVRYMCLEVCTVRPKTFGWEERIEVIAEILISADLEGL
jgi:hypothetical protein